MRRLLTCGFILLAQLLWAACALGQGGYKIEVVGAAPSSDLAQSQQDALQPQGTRLLDEQGAAVCEVWLRKTVPTQQAAGGSGEILYGGLGTGTVVGVLRFPKGGSDFRGQPIKVGLYTLRYALIPQDGNHMGVSPYRDFLLLGPAAVDTDLNKEMTYDDVIKLSRQASGTPHPAILSLVPVNENAAQSLPALAKDDQGHWVLKVKLQGKPAAGGQGQEFPLAIILVGKAEA